MSIPNDRVAANAALLRLFKNEYRESSDRHSDSLLVRDYCGGLEAENTKLRAALTWIVCVGVHTDDPAERVTTGDLRQKARDALGL